MGHFARSWRAHFRGGVNRGHRPTALSLSPTSGQRERLPEQTIHRTLELRTLAEYTSLPDSIFWLLVGHDSYLPTSIGRTVNATPTRSGQRRVILEARESAHYCASGLCRSARGRRAAAVGDAASPLSTVFRGSITMSRWLTHIEAPLRRGEYKPDRSCFILASRLRPNVGPYDAVSALW
jgi:hypothetical protein